MDIISRLSLHEEWEGFLDYKANLCHISKSELEDLKSFIENREYLKTAEKIQKGEEFPYPKKILLNKKGTGKKRIVYVYPREESYLLKLISFMLRDFDHCFAPNLYSFRKNRGVKRAVNDILSHKNLDSLYVYKVDIHDYFNSADVQLLLPMLKEALGKEERLFEFLKNLLENPFAESEEGLILQEQKGIMAGVPTAAFLANLYLSSLDWHFYEEKVIYMRYSDDILVFGKTREEAEAHRDYILNTLTAMNLTVNPKKESFSNPYEEWTFLGFSYHNKIIDVSKISTEKLKSKMRRKTRALKRWADRKGLEGEKPAKVFIRKFNQKLFDNPVDSELTWTKWFFPIITTDRSLKEIDGYMQECIRYLGSGKRNKGKYKITYDQMKEWGYINLVNEYHKKSLTEDEK